MILLLFIIAGAGLIIGSITDLRTREVPDWVNYSLIFGGLGLRTLYAAISWDYRILLEGIFGFGVGYIIALGMFYSGQWGGGDSKMLMGLGGLFGLTWESDAFLFGFLINLLLAGAVYGIFWMFGLIIVRNAQFSKSFKAVLRQKRGAQSISLISSSLILIMGFFMVSLTVKTLLIALGIMIAAVFYLWVAIRAVEKACMIKPIPVSRLTEGDWIVKDVKVGGKRVCGPKDLGISREQIAQLKQAKVKEVIIKEGIPFVPSFLLAFILSLTAGNILFYALSFL